MLNTKSSSPKHPAPSIKSNSNNKKKSFARSRIMKSLESMATVPNARYGDSVQKVKNSFETLLLAQGLPADVNVAIILSRNNMDINKENFYAVKSLRDAIQKLRNDLHPLEAALLFTEGKNPLDMTVDDIQAFHDSLPNYGDNSGDKLAENILKLDKDLDVDIRGAVVNLYRCFAVIDQNGGAAIGSLIASGKSATLGSLLSEAQNFGNHTEYIIGLEIDERAQLDTMRQMIAKGLNKAKQKLTT
ncbi:MAG: DUF6240 domain-containing protein [Clostridiales bacterium]|nr:DUF6240 domain-containing protein [Clostridiales bacterium]